MQFTFVIIDVTNIENSQVENKLFFFFFIIKKKWRRIENLKLSWMVVGIVEFVEPAEARTAFKRLAYSRFKNLPLYLEWAPEDTFTSSSKETDERETKPGIVSCEKYEIYWKFFVSKFNSWPLLESSKNENLSVSDGFDEEPEPETTLFIKNLNFETTEDAIKRVDFFANYSQ